MSRTRYVNRIEEAENRLKGADALVLLLNQEIKLLRKRITEKDILIKEQQEQIDILEAKIFK